LDGFRGYDVKPVSLSLSNSSSSMRVFRSSANHVRRLFGKNDTVMVLHGIEWKKAKVVEVKRETIMDMVAPAGEAPSRTVGGASPTAMTTPRMPVTSGNHNESGTPRGPNPRDSGSTPTFQRTHTIGNLNSNGTGSRIQMRSQEGWTTKGTFFPIAKTVPSASSSSSCSSSASQSASATTSLGPSRSHSKEVPPAPGAARAAAGSSSKSGPGLADSNVAEPTGGTSMVFSKALKAKLKLLTVTARNNSAPAGPDSSASISKIGVDHNRNEDGGERRKSIDGMFGPEIVVRFFKKSVKCSSDSDSPTADLQAELEVLELEESTVLLLSGTVILPLRIAQKPLDFFRDRAALRKPVAGTQSQILQSQAQVGNYHSTQFLLPVDALNFALEQTDLDLTLDKGETLFKASDGADGAEDLDNGEQFLV